MKTKDELYSMLRSSWSAYGHVPTLHELKVRIGRDLLTLRQALIELRERVNQMKARRRSRVDPAD